MNDLLDQITNIINSVKNDNDKLQQILNYLNSEIVEEEDDQNDSYIALNELPDKYKTIVNEIAQYIDMGMFCFLNPTTNELDFIPQEIYYEVNYEDDSEKMKKELNDMHGWEVIKFLDWDKYFSFEPLPSFESFQIMEKFTYLLPDDKPIRSRLLKALRNRKPFANFGRIIDDSDLREQWFEFKQQWLDNLVAKQLLEKLENIDENKEDI